MLILDSVTVFPPEARGRAAIAASHGGVYAAYLAAKAGIKAVILCDAGVGRERAGIGGLDYLDRLGVPAAAIGHRSARIGHGADCSRRGVITFANARAAALGITPGMPRAGRLTTCERATCRPPRRRRRCRGDAPSPDRSRGAGRAGARDQLRRTGQPEDDGHIVATGSHGGLLGGRPEPR